MSEIKVFAAFLKKKLLDSCSRGNSINISQWSLQFRQWTITWDQDEYKRKIIHNV